MARRQRPVFPNLAYAQAWARHTLEQLAQPPFITPEYKDNIAGRIQNLISEYENWPDLDTANMWITFAFEELEVENLEFIFFFNPLKKAGMSRMDATPMRTILENDEENDDNDLTDNEQEAKAAAADSSVTVEHDAINTVSFQASQQIAAANSGVTLADNFNQPAMTHKQVLPPIELEKTKKELRERCLYILNRTEGKVFKKRNDRLSGFIQHITNINKCYHGFEKLLLDAQVLREKLNAQNNAIEHPQLTKLKKWGEKWLGKATNRESSQSNNEGMAFSLDQTPPDASNLTLPRDLSELTPVPETPRMPPGYENHVEHGVPFREFSKKDQRSPMEKLQSAIKTKDAGTIIQVFDNNFQVIVAEAQQDSIDAADTLSKNWQAKLESNQDNLKLTEGQKVYIARWAKQHHKLLPIEQAFLEASIKGHANTLEILKPHITRLIPNVDRQHFILSLAITRRANAITASLRDISNDPTLEQLLNYEVEPFHNANMLECITFFRKEYEEKPRRRRRAPTREFRVGADTTGKSAKTFFLTYNDDGSTENQEPIISDIHFQQQILQSQVIPAGAEERKATPAPQPEAPAKPPPGLFNTDGKKAAEQRRADDEAKAPPIGEEKAPDASKDGVEKEHAVPLNTKPAAPASKPPPSIAKSLGVRMMAVILRKTKPRLKQQPKPRRQAKTEPVIVLDLSPENRAEPMRATNATDLYRETYEKISLAYTEGKSTIVLPHTDDRQFERERVFASVALLIQAQACDDFIRETKKTRGNKGAIPNVFIQVNRDKTATPKAMPKLRSQIGAVVGEHRRPHIVWLSGVIGLALISPTAHLMNLGLSATLGTNLWFAAVALLVAQVAYVAYQVINNSSSKSTQHANNLGSAWDTLEEMGFKEQGGYYVFKQLPANTGMVKAYIEAGRALIAANRNATSSASFSPAPERVSRGHMSSPPASQPPDPKPGQQI